MFLAIPSFVGLALCSDHLISTLFQRGEFTFSDVNQASKSLIAFSLGLPFFMLMKVLVPAFFSRQDTKTPMYAAIAALISNIILHYVFVFIVGYDHAGLALASSISATLSCGILFLILSFILIEKNVISYVNTLVIFDTHWFTTSGHVVAGASSFNGIYTSEELPDLIKDHKYNWNGCADLATKLEKNATFSFFLMEIFYLRKYKTL